MLQNAIKYVCDAVERQNYKGLYMPQAVPVLGPLVSIPTALVSGVMAIVKVTQAVWLKLKEGTPFLRPAADESFAAYPLEDAADLGAIFANSVLNLCTFGILNNCIVCHIFCNIRCSCC